VQITGRGKPTDIEERLLSLVRSAVRESDAYMTGMLLTGIGKGFLSFDGGA
jgi:hypothetical protein